MRLLTLILILIATPVIAADEVAYIKFTYDAQGVAEYVPEEVGLISNGDLYCSTTEVTQDDETQEYHFHCEDGGFPPDDYAFQVVIKCVDGVNVFSNLATVTIPPEPEPLPPRKSPVIEEGYIEMEDGTIIEMEIQT